MLRASLLLLCITFTGCVSKSAARRESEKAYLRGKQDAIRTHQQKQMQHLHPSVTVLGKVANATIPWSDELTASRAIVAAQYQAHQDPESIVVHRQGQIYTLSVQLLLRGQQDLPLEPGDVVEIR